MLELNLLHPEAYSDVLSRLEISSASPSFWGKMVDTQMLAHLSVNLEVVSRERARQMLMSRLFDKLAKRQILREGMPKNIESSPHLIVPDARNFEGEKGALLQRLRRLLADGEESVTRQLHPFFGRMFPNEWARLQSLHTDHHFKHFGV